MAAASTSSVSSVENISTSANNNTLYTLKITLQDERSVGPQGRWRRVIVPANFSLLELHVVIQDVFDWKGYHLHNFTRSVRRNHFNQVLVEYRSVIGAEEDYFMTEVGQQNGVFARNSHVHDIPASISLASLRGDNDPFSFFIGPEQIREERLYKLHHVFSQERRVLDYEYDFGASWELKVELEGTVDIVALEQDVEYPKCVDGSGANRLEDRNDESGMGELLPRYRRKVFDLEKAQRNLRKTFAGKWPLVVDNLSIGKCYMCKWYSAKVRGCPVSRCHGTCCDFCLKAECIQELTPLDDEQADQLFAATAAELKAHRRQFLQHGLCMYREPDGSDCCVCNSPQLPRPWISS